MSSEAPESTLKSLCLLIVDCPHATPKWTDSGVIVLRNQNIKRGRLDLSEPSYTDEEHYLRRVRRAVPQASDIVITREAPMGDVCQIPVGLKCCLGQRQVLLRPDSNLVEPRFLLYALQSPYLQNQIDWSEGTGSTVSNLRIPVLEALRVPTPSLSFQREVSTILGVLDDQIDLLRESNKTLESIAQALFKSWFLDFDPVLAKIEGRIPVGTNEGIAVLFPDSFETSDLGLKPSGWTVGSISEIASESTRRIGNAQATILSAIQTSELVRSADHFHKQVHSEDTSKYKAVFPFSFAYNPSRINIGSIGINEICEMGAVSPIYVVVCPIAKHYGYYLWHFLRTNRTKEAIRTMASGTVRQSLSYKDFSSIPLILPPADLAIKFFEIRTAIYECFNSNARKIETITELRNVILPRLISGKIPLNEARTEIELCVT